MERAGHEVVWSGRLEPLREESRHLFDAVVWDGGGGIRDLLTSTTSLVDPTLAELYGVDHRGEGSVVVDLPANERSGILTRGAFLTVHAHSEAPSPVQRGLFVRTRVLCDDVPAPPPEVDASPPDAWGDPRTNRERLEAHSADPACAACHVYMDPIGFGFEHYDQSGRWRDEDNGHPVDATGELLFTDDVDGAFDGAVHLSEVLAGSDQVERCMATQLFRYAAGRRADRPDDATLHQLLQRSEQTAGSVTEMMVGLLTTDDFRFLPAVQENP